MQQSDNPALTKRLPSPTKANGAVPFIQPPRRSSNKGLGPVPRSA